MPRRRCFVIMPFDRSFDDIFRDIATTAELAGLDCKRGDHHRRSGAILEQIIEDIAASDLVIADFSFGNSNVFYETGIAHRVRGIERTIHIARRKEDVPSDLVGHRYLLYEHSDDGRIRLRQELGEWIRTFLSEKFPETEEILVGKILRTQKIVDACQVMAREFGGRDARNPLIVRSIAGVASLAISDREHDEGEPEYQSLLRAERDSLLALLDSGAEFRLILHPPTKRSKDRPWDRLAHRLRRMILLLEGQCDSSHPDHARLDALVAGRCRVAFSDIPRLNTLILGDRIAFEAFRRGVDRGFEGTLWTTRRKDIERQNDDFDSLFKACSRTGPVGEPGRQGPAIERLRKDLDEYRTSCGDEWDDAALL